MVSKFVVAVRVLAFCVPVVLVLLACTTSGSGKANVRCVGQGTGVSCDVTECSLRGPRARPSAGEQASEP